MRRDQAPSEIENVDLKPGLTSEFPPRKALLIAGLMLALNAAPASAIEATAIEGRWRTTDNRLTIDISRCSEGFCGRRVIVDQTNPDRQCDRTVLTVALAEPPTRAEEVVLSGKLDLPENGGAHTAVVTIRPAAPGQSVLMKILGRGVDEPIFSRRMPLMVEMARVGDAVCQPAPTS